MSFSPTIFCGLSTFHSTLPELIKSSYLTFFQRGCITKSNNCTWYHQGVSFFALTTFLYFVKASLKADRFKILLRWDLKTVRDNIPPLTEFPLTSSLRIHKAFGISKLGPWKSPASLWNIPRAFGIFQIGPWKYSGSLKSIQGVLEISYRPRTCKKPS